MLGVIAVLGGSLAVYMVFNASLNFVRLVSLILTGLVWNEALDVAHLLVWQSVMILASVMIWITWLRRTSQTKAA